MTSGVSEEQLVEYRTAFALFDKNGDGHISTAELGEALKQVGRKATHAEVARLAQNVDKDKSGKIDFNEFVTLMVTDEKRKQDELRKTFNQFDTDKSGYITKAELKAALKRAGENASDAEVDKMIKDVDTDGDKKVSFAEFCKMMN